MEPWGFPIRDVQTAMIASTVAQAAGAKMKLEDFMLGDDHEVAEDYDPAVEIAKLLGAELPPKPAK